MCVQFPVTVPINGVISCEDFDKNFQSLKAFVDAFCNLDEIVANIEMWATEAEASAEAALLALEQIETIQMQLQPLVDAITELLNLEANLDDVLAVEAALTNINIVASNIADINTVAAGVVNVGIVAGSIANVNTVAGSIGNVNIVGGDIANVNIVAGDIANVNTVAGNIGAINNVEAALPEITTVEANLTDIETVADDITNVNTVATNITALLQIVTNLATILDASNQAAIAVQAALDAEAARDEILDMIDFTGAVNGDLLQHNGSEFVAVSREDLGKQRELFIKSPLPLNGYPNSMLYAWDNCERANENPTVLTDSGHTYTNIFGASQLQVLSNRLRPTSSDSSINAILTGFGAQSIIGYVGLSQISSRLGLAIGKDANNYYTCYFVSNNFIVDKIISGVRTNLFTVGSGTPNNRADHTRPLLVDFTYLWKGRFDQFALRVKVPQLNIHQIIDVTADAATFLNASDVAFAGWYSETGTPYDSWRIYNIPNIL